MYLCMREEEEKAAIEDKDRWFIRTWKRLKRKAKVIETNIRYVTSHKSKTDN